ncbi:MAG: hypothetical protein C4336_04900 [Armatimonadota bacterium]
MKLNLVPDYVRQRKVNKQIIALLVVLFFVVNAAMVFWMVTTRTRLSELQERKTELEAQANRVDTLNSQAEALVNQAALTLAKSEWKKVVEQHNLKYPEFYSKLNQYTSPRVRYASLQIQQANQLQISAYAKGIREIGVYLQTMYQCPLFTAVSLTTQMPGYPAGATGGQVGGMLGGLGGGAPLGPMAGGLTAASGGPSGGFGLGAPAGGKGQDGGSPAGLMNFQVVATLKEPMTPPAPPGLLNIGGGTGAGGGFGMPGGFGGGTSAPPRLGGRGLGI